MINLDFEISKRTAYIIMAVVTTALIILGVVVVTSPEVVNFRYL